jgi:hypothetical protein
MLLRKTGISAGSGYPVGGLLPRVFYWTHVAKPEWQTLNVGDVLKQREPEEGAEKKVETKPRKKLTFPSHKRDP